MTSESSNAHLCHSYNVTRQASNCTSSLPPQCAVSRDQHFAARVLCVAFAPRVELGVCGHGGTLHTASITSQRGGLSIATRVQSDVQCSGIRRCHARHHDDIGANLPQADHKAIIARLRNVLLLIALSSAVLVCVPGHLLWIRNAAAERTTRRDPKVAYAPRQMIAEMRIHRTHDGRTFDVTQPIEAFADKADLTDAIALVSSIPCDELICMTSQGQQLTDELLEKVQEERERPSSSQSTLSPLEFYVFNRQFLYSELDPLLHELEQSEHLEPAATGPELAHPPTPKILDLVVAWSREVLATVQRHAADAELSLQELDTINKGTLVALANLLSHADTVKSGAEVLEASAVRELTRMKELLAAHGASLKTLSLVQINPKLLPPPAENKARNKERCLADYVSPTKMDAVYNACTEVCQDLEQSLANLKANGSQLMEDLAGLRKEVESTSILPSKETYDEAKQASERAQTLQRFLDRQCSPDEHGWPAAERLAEDEELFGEVHNACHELLLLDEVVREALRRLIADKNDMIARSLHLLSDISSLQSEHADLASGLAQLDAELQSSRTDSFRHLSRLRNMLWAYGSTLIEAHRRKEFEKRFINHSQALAEVMASFSESETRRRQDFRSQVSGALPWEVKGLEDATPSLEISTGGTTSSSIGEIEQVDIDAFFTLLDSIEEQLGPGLQGKDVAEVRAAAQRLLASLDEAEAEFERLVETNLLEKQEQSGSEDDASERTPRLASAKMQKLHEKELQDLRMHHADKERHLAEDHDRQMSSLRAELNSLRIDLRARSAAAEQEADAHVGTKRALEAAKTEAETEQARRVNMEEELRRLREEIEGARRDEKAAKAELSDEIDRAHELTAHVSDLQIELDELREARNDAVHRIESLLSKGSTDEQELAVAQERIDDLTQQLSTLRGEMREAHEALHEAEMARDKLLRNYRAEADGDRAILEENLRTKDIELKEAEQIIKRHEANLVEHAHSAENYKSQLSAADEAHEDLVRQLESEREAGTDAEMARRQSERALESIMDHVHILANGMVALLENLDRVQIPSSSKNGKHPIETKDETPNGMTERARAIEALTKRCDDTGAEKVIEALDWLAKANPGDEAMKKLDSLTTLCKKWMKAYKYANEKGQKQLVALREKITFRNFAVGDLALFLPTRSSFSSTYTSSDAKANASKPWAAFNINCPHYFLNFSGRPENEKLRDSLRHKEWIVARIVRIDSEIVSSQDESNPFQLAEGVRYFLLEVESWNSTNSAVGPGLAKRKISYNSAEADSTTKASEIPPTPRYEMNDPMADGKREAEEEARDTPLAVVSEPPSPAEARDSAVKSDAETIPRAATQIAGSESALTIVMRNRSLSSETSRVHSAPKSSNFSRELANASLAPPLARWPLPADRHQTSLNPGSVSSATSFASSANALRLLDDSSPAFGRSKGGRKIIATEKNSSSTKRRSQSGVDADKFDAHTHREAMPLNIAQRSGLRIAGGDDEGINPFSSSPAPGGIGSLGRKEALASERQLSSSAGTRPERAPHAEDSTTETEQAVNDEPRDESRDLGPCSMSSRASVSSRLSALHIRSRPSALNSPRLRFQAILAPSVSKEIAQGSNAYSPTLSRSPEHASVKSGAGGSGFSQVASSSANRIDTASTSGPQVVTNVSTSSPKISISMPEHTSPKQSPLPSTRALADQQTISPAKARERRSSTLFGGSWILGRRKSTNSQTSGSSRPRQASPSIRDTSFFSRPDPQVRSPSNEGDVGLPTAKQHLRRLASTSGIE